SAHCFLVAPVEPKPLRPFWYLLFIQIVCRIHVVTLLTQTFRRVPRCVLRSAIIPRSRRRLRRRQNSAPAPAPPTGQNAVGHPPIGGSLQKRAWRQRSAHELFLRGWGEQSVRRDRGSAPRMTQRSVPYDQSNHQKR